MEATCKTCPLFHVERDCDGDAPGFECRASPVAVGVDPDHWCGEHPLRQRDRLAAMAMQGWLASWPPDRLLDAGGEKLAAASYAAADAMLAARAPSPRENTP